MEKGDLLGVDSVASAQVVEWSVCKVAGLANHLPCTDSELAVDSLQMGYPGQGIHKRGIQQQTHQFHCSSSYGHSLMCPVSQEEVVSLLHQATVILDSQI